MKKLLHHIILLTSLAVFNAGCMVSEIGTSEAIARVMPASEKSENSLNEKNSAACPRSEPEPIIKKDFFRKTSFRLEKNREYPFQNLGHETVEFENGDKLLIEHIGCENFTLVFHYKTNRFSRDPKDARFWYKTAIELVNETVKAIQKTELPRNGLEALKSHIEKTEELKYRDFVEFCDPEIRCVVSLDVVKESENNLAEIIVSFGIGPL